MSGSGSRSYPGQWEEGQLRMAAAAVDVVPYAMLAFCAILTVVLYNAHWETGSPRVPLVLCGLAAAWTLGMYTLRPAWREQPRRMGVFVAVLLAIMAVMVTRYSWLGFYTFTGFYYVYRLVGSWRWRIASIGVVCCYSGISQGLGLQIALTLPHVLLLVGAILVNVLGGCALTWFTWASYRQGMLRNQLFDELAETNSRLEATLAENTGLHRQLLSQAREAGVLDERQRMAREIHDTLAQGLTGIITQLQASERDPAQRRRHVDAAVALARESLTEARRSVRALRPQELESALLGEALTGVAHRWTERSGVPAQVTVTGTVRPMTAEAESALLRTAQEALTNVAKHAAATRVGLTLSYMDDEVVLDVRDDGRGFDPARPAVPGRLGGFGLVAMRQRIEGLSGTLDVESEPGAGTAISARVPAEPAGRAIVPAEPVQAGS